MSVFFSDLDNTLIYSHHRRIEGPKIVAEHLDGKEQGFITRFTYEYLVGADWLDIVPVTTRTDLQFKRIEIAGALRVKYAILCNGGKLLIDYKEDKDWSEETYFLIKDHIGSIEEASRILGRICKGETVHTPENYMCYAKSDNPEIVKEILERELNLNEVNVQIDHRKVYIFANGVTKGEAVKRFKNRFGQVNVIAAGDSSMDVSMLNEADYAFAGKGIDMFVKKHIPIEDGIFSDEICRGINQLHTKGII